MKIEPLIHRCTIQSGDLAGNDFVVEVMPCHIEFEERCANCGEHLATPHQAVAHIYEQLTS